MVSIARSQITKGVGAVVLYAIIFHLCKSIASSQRVRSYLPDFPELPQISLDYHRSLYNESKVALLIENRRVPHIAPMILAFMSTLPPDWRFRFMGSEESVIFVNRSAAIRQQARAGKLDLTHIPKNMTTNGQEDISRFLTNLWLYETVLAPAEWLLIFQTDSMMCGNHKGTLDEWLDYDWVGAPWNPGSRYGGNGGLSLRRISAMTEVLRHQERAPNTDPEDVWLTERLGHLPNSRAANGSESLKFSCEMHYYDEPLGYHTGGGGHWVSGGVWGTPEKRKHNYDYCPEMKLTLHMDVRQFYPKMCGEYW